MYFIVFIQNLIFIFFDIIFYVAILLNQKAFTFTTPDHSVCYLFEVFNAEIIISRTGHDRPSDWSSITIP